MVLFKIIGLILILIGILLIIIINILAKKNNNYPTLKTNKHNFCVLIPARDESKVIEGLLKSIKKQSYKVDMKNVYVIVEDKKDKTIDICRRYNANFFIRKRLDLKTKGYALDEGVKYILSSKKKYDAYFIFDADNVLDKDYFKNMIPIFDKGYDLACGYRNCKNNKQNVVCASSELTFSVVNTVFNFKKNKSSKNIIFSGTGFYIRGYLIEKWGSYPFHSLTEDYELSIYATVNNLTTYYNINSIFYDEQPMKFKDTINQRTRWIRGYFDVRKLYTKQLIKKIKKDNCNYGSIIDETFGIIPYVFIILGLILWFFQILFNLIYNLFIHNDFYKTSLLELIIFIFFIYFILVLITLIIIILEGKKINLDAKIKLKILFYNPIFMISYIFCAIKALTSKNISWKKIEHGNEKKS